MEMDCLQSLMHNFTEGALKRTLEVINRMVEDGVLDRYAIGGAVGATFYLEPSATLDVDIFVLFPPASRSPLISLAPLYAYLQERRYRTDHKHVIVEDWPVQFLPAADDLQEEAVREAVNTEVDG